MNKRIVCFTCVALVLGGGVASAQITAGLKAGLSLANMSFNEPGNSLTPTSRQGFVGGAFVEIPVARHLAIQPEALFTMKGAEYALSGPALPGGVATMRFTYLDVPLLMRVDVPTTGTIVPFVYAGPTFNFLLTARSTSTLSGTVREEDCGSDCKSTEVAIAFGGGVRFGRFLADVRYTQGLTNVLAAGVSVAEVTMKHHAIQLLAGLRF